MGVHKVASFSPSPRLLRNSKLAQTSRLSQPQMTSVAPDDVKMTISEDYGFVGGSMAKKTLSKVTSLLMAAYSEAKSPEARKKR